MFELIYLVILACASVPFIRTVLAARRDNWNWKGRVNAAYTGSSYIAAVVVVITLLEVWGFGIAADSLWFTELGQSKRYWLVLGYQIEIFAVMWLALGGFVGYNLHQLVRPLPLPNGAAWWGAFVVALPFAYLATNLWMPITAFLGAEPTGVLDPIFGKDTSFYLLQLPLYQNVVACGIVAAAVTLMMWATVAAIFYSRAGAPWISEEKAEDEFHTSRLKARQYHEKWEGELSHGRAIWGQWMRQGYVLGAILFLLSGVDQLLDRYGLMINGHSGVISGASYSDVHWWMPMYTTIALGWFVAAAFLVLCSCYKALRDQLSVPLFRAFGFPIPTWAAPVALFALVWLVIPAGLHIAQAIYVKPNEITLERSYLLHTIKGTRTAYNLEGQNVSEREFAVSEKALSRADLEANAATMRDARIWDWRPLGSQLQQIQAQRPYYHVTEVDIDRYAVDGEERQVMVTPRELDLNLLPEQARVWVNQKLKYTHGYGMVAVPVNEMDNRGNPMLWSRDVPVTARKELTVEHAAIYYGEFTKNHVYVKTLEKEFDFPQGDQNAEVTYGGKGGVVLSSFWRDVVFARQLEGIKLFTSGYLTHESRVLWRRNIKERAQLLAPFLHFDRDPYMVAGGDHYYWILDAYTAAKTYPYSDDYNGALQSFRNYNYIRNSVKTVIDAYDGTVTFYVFDARDPIIKAYRKMLPGLFRDASEMPQVLRSHVRYPEDLFTIQAEMYGTYHMTNPMTFYNREDRWEIPQQLFREKQIPMLPYYVTTQLPGSAKPEFLLMLPLTVAGKNQMAGWLAGLSDGDNYGKLVAYTFPKGIFVDGPAQVDSRISSNDEMSQKFTLWNQQGSKVIRGNLLILPLANNVLIAIQPVYIEADQTKIPTLTRVILAQLMPNDRNIVWANTLTEAQDLLVGGKSVAVAVSSSTEGGVTLERIKEIFGKMRDAYSAGNFGAAGEQLEELKRLLSQ